MTTTPHNALPSDNERELVEALRAKVSQQIHDHVGETTLADGEQRALVERLLQDALDAAATDRLNQGKPYLSPDAEARVAQRVRDKLLGFGGLQRLLDDHRIENINVNGYDQVFVRYHDGTREQVAPIADSDDEVIDLVRTLAARGGVEERRFDRASPRLSMQLPDGSRLFAVMAVVPRPSLSIRRHRFLKVTLADLTANGTIDEHLARFFTAVVLARKNTIIAGPTGVGKTTALRALASVIPAHERIVTIEDSRELALEQDPAHPDVVPMQTREANIEGHGETTMSDLVRDALRMDPDRVIVGEVRGVETVPMLNAMSLGNDGSMATIHASDTAGVFLKLSTYAAQSAERLSPEATNLLVASAVDFVVHLGRMADGSRAVTSVREVTGADGLQVASNEIFQPGPDGRAVPGAPMSTAMLDELIAAGYEPYGHNGWGGVQ